jgi:hypothetical protein
MFGDVLEKELLAEKSPGPGGVVSPEMASRAESVVEEIVPGQ